MDFPEWRSRARVLLAQGIAPEEGPWVGNGGLLDGAFASVDDGAAAGDHAAPGVESADAPADAMRARRASPPQAPGIGPNVPRRLVDLLERAFCHRPRPEALMYRVIWRMAHGERRLLDDAADDDVARLTRMARAVDRACHKMTAFVRFRAIGSFDPVRYVAWFEPEHDVLRRTAPFFVRRFATMHWAIATPDGTACWDGVQLAFLPFDPAAIRPAEDAAQALWLTYYRSIFNPARLNVAMMRKEMPVHYWKNLPEAAAIPALVADAPRRAGRMVEECVRRDTAADRASAGPKAEPTAMAGGSPRLPSKEELDTCRRCPLGATATQAVPGRGPRAARLMLVGEQPGDEEDLAGQPFVGPAGRLLDTVLARARIDRGSVYMTNAVKHFGFEPRGKRRIHKTPAQRDIAACRTWLEAEIAAQRPRVIVTLGVTALKSVIPRPLTLRDARTLDLVHATGTPVIATVHPAAVLRAPDEDARQRMLEMLTADLVRAATQSAAGPADTGSA